MGSRAVSPAEEVGEFLWPCPCEGPGPAETLVPPQGVVKGKVLWSTCADWSFKGL